MARAPRSRPARWRAPADGLAERPLRHGELLVAAPQRARGRREEAVVRVHGLEGLLAALGDVGEERAERGRARRRERRLADEEAPGVQAREQARRRRLDVALAADQLPRQE